MIDDMLFLRSFMIIGIPGSTSPGSTSPVRGKVESLVLAPTGSGVVAPRINTSSRVVSSLNCFS